MGNERFPERRILGISGVAVGKTYLHKTFPSSWGFEKWELMLVGQKSGRVRLWELETHQKLSVSLSLGEHFFALFCRIFFFCLLQQSRGRDLAFFLGGGGSCVDFLLLCPPPKKSEQF